MNSDAWDPTEVVAAVERVYTKELPLSIGREATLEALSGEPPTESLGRSHARLRGACGVWRTDQSQDTIEQIGKILALQVGLRTNTHFSKIQWEPKPSAEAAEAVDMVVWSW